MKLQHRPLQPKSHRNLRKRPPLIHPVRHNLHIDQAHWDRRALEVRRFAGLVFRHHGDSDVEARETCEAAEDEEGEQEVVHGCAEAKGEGGGCGSDAEGDLWVGGSVVRMLCWRKGAYQVSERVEFLAHETGLLPPARDLPVHEVEEQAERDKAEGEVEVGVVVWVVLDAVAERGEDGHDAAEACSLLSMCSRHE